jgi:hypothetical protein
LTERDKALRVTLGPSHGPVLFMYYNLADLKLRKSRHRIQEGYCYTCCRESVFEQTCQQSSQLDRYQAGASSWLINQAKLE